MNKKNPCLLFAGSILAVTLLASGCATGVNHAPPVAIGTNGLISVAGHEIQPQDMQIACRVASQAGTSAALRHDENSRAYLQAAEVVFDAAIQGGQYDPVILNQSLSTISVKEARDPKVTAGIESALGVYSMFFGGMVTAKISNLSPYAVPALTGLRDGIETGLLMNPPRLKMGITNGTGLP